MSEMSVDLPEPVEPTMATVSPRAASNVMSASTAASAPGYVNAAPRNATVPGVGNSVTGCSGRRSVDSLASTSLMRSADTAARGIMIVMKVAMSTPMRICPTYCMNANSVPISTAPASTWMPPNQITPTTVTFSTSIASGNSSTNNEPTLRPTTMMSWFASRKRSASMLSRTNARTTRTPVSCSRRIRLMASSLAWNARNSGTMRLTISVATSSRPGTATAISQLRPTSCCSAMMMPPIASSGAVTSMVAPIIASICTCCTSFVLRVISEPGPNCETSRSENALTFS